MDMMGILDLDRITPADRTNLDDVIRELDETRMLCERLNAVIENAPDGIYVTDGEANAIRINPAFEQISGLDRKKMLGVNHRQLEKDGVVAESSSLLASNRHETVTIIHEYLQTGLQALVTSKPVFNEKKKIQMVVSSIRDVTELSAIKGEMEKQQEDLKQPDGGEEQTQTKALDSDPIAVDKKMRDLIHTAARIAAVDSTVLITGETGTGKEEIAKFIHTHSPRKTNSFIAINCGAIPESLVESELFGYEEGAFTGARKKGKPGVFELADQGTVFLDEIGELSLDVQTKLLRVMENSVITRVGGIKPIKVDIRIVAATNRHLKEMVKAGTFRQDLYYRLNIVPLHVPPLRERKDDILPLAKYFLNQINKKYGMNKKMSNQASTGMLQYEWPGNVRELKNLIESLCVLYDQNVITLQNIGSLKAPNQKVELSDSEISLKERMERIEYMYLLDAYDSCGNVRDAAESLQMPMATYVRKKKHYQEKYDAP